MYLRQTKMKSLFLTHLFFSSLQLAFMKHKEMNL